ncbi:MAG: 6,7-dimethyl-8-ribityllumazine synthase [Candidatus Pelagibacter sp.]|nr:6,7-dimethyl-8-ribityllumazine synthase [Candidatus Pelagibacter sp.]OUV97570.1 MAG: 6,7-dimethyl-8-ribityllumazine synthase [Candidatus Pelagibacter sp. TMED142]|tara:strand:- start:3224 stop:3634 length:411 start_codon:yes stop_codon:yes gene_type:complete
MKKKCLLVYSDYYPEISKSLVNGSIKILKKNKIKYDIKSVSGCFEIPQLINILLKKKKYNLCVVLGCIIKGQTPHFSLLSNSIIKSISYLSIKYECPIGFGIITSLNKKQATERSSFKKNKGVEATTAAISVLKNI